MTRIGRGRQATGPIAWVRRHGVVLLLVAALSAAGAGAATAPVDAGSAACHEAGAPALPAWQRLADGLWWLPAAEGDATPANGGFVTPVVLALGPAGTWWLVGSGPTPAFGRAVVCDLARRWGVRVSDVVNTRAHPEGVMGNTAFAEARVWALAGVADAMRERCGDCVARLRERLGPAGAGLGASSIRVPDRRLEGTRGALGPFDWQAMSAGAGRPSLLLRHRASGVWIADGWAWPGAVPDLREADSGAWRKALGDWIGSLGHGTEAGAVRILGSQGPIGSRADLEAHGTYVDRLTDVVRRALDAGQSEADAQPALATALPPAATPLDRLRHGLNAQRVWRELEAGSFGR